MPECGFLYIALGDKFIEEAKTSAQSLKKVDREAHITIVTSTDFENHIFDNKIILNATDYSRKGGLIYKITGLKLTPYDKTLFLDTDTYFCESCRELFQLLNFFDLMIAPAVAAGATAEFNGNMVSGYYAYNTGVIAYNNTSKVNNFINNWEMNYSNYTSTRYLGNQPAFMQTLLYSDIKTYTLSSIYNFRTPYYTSAICGPVKIIHGRHENYQEIASEINSSYDFRCWDPFKERIIYKKSKYSFKKSIPMQIYDKLPEAVKNIYRKFKSAK